MRVCNEYKITHTHARAVHCTHAQPMAWCMTMESMANSFGLFLDAAAGADATYAGGQRGPLAAGSMIEMKGMIPGSFGIRYSKPIVGTGGGSTVCIISELNDAYVGVDTHVDTMCAIVTNSNRPELSYAAGKGEKTTSAYMKWSQGHFEDLCRQAKTWRRDYSKESDSPHSKIWMFLRLRDNVQFLCLGRYRAKWYDKKAHVLHLLPFDDA